MRLISTNKTLITPVSYSSQDSNFPASNLSNSFREKEWRSSGFYKVTSSNNKIEWTNYTVDIGPFPENPPRVVVSEYDSTSLRHAVGSAMSYRRNPTYHPNPFEVSFDQSTKKFTISNADNFELNNTSDSVLRVMGFTQSTYTGSNTYTSENVAIHTSEYVVFDLGISTSLDSFVLLWGANTPKLTESAVVKIYANSTNTWSSPSLDATLTIEDSKQVSSLFLETPHSARYWKVEISDPTNTNFYVNLGVCFFGLKDTIRNADNGYTWNLSDGSIRSRTPYGQEYVDEYPVLKSISFSMNNLDYEDVLTLNDIYRTVGSKNNVYFELYDNLAGFDKDFFCIYGKFDSSLGFQHVNYKIFNGSLTITETN